MSGIKCGPQDSALVFRSVHQRPIIKESSESLQYRKIARLISGLMLRGYCSFSELNSLYVSLHAEMIKISDAALKAQYELRFYDLENFRIRCQVNEQAIPTLRAIKNHSPELFDRSPTL
jgi:hypothetical protein